MAAYETIALFAVLLLRLAIPLIVTLVLIIFLRHLDQRWQQESLRETIGASGSPVTLEKARCWEIFGCTPEKKARCRAYKNPDKPCWEAITRDGSLMECCRNCPFRNFRLAQNPV